MTVTDTSFIEDDEKNKASGLDSANAWTLMWLRFKKHRLALFSLFFLGFAYLVAIFAEFVAPYAPDSIERLQTFVPPQTGAFLHEGSLQRPFVYELKRKRDPETAKVIYAVNRDKMLPVQFFRHW